MPLFRDDRELLQRFRSGERAALELVYRKYLPQVEAIIRHGFRLPSRGIVVRGLALGRSDAADLVQEVFVKAFSESARKSYDGLRDYGPYLFMIARNVLADWGRRNGREIPVGWNELAPGLQVEPASEGDEPWAEPATIAAVERYLAGLDPELRRVHEQRYVHGLSQRDAAAALGLSRQQIRTLEDRLRQGLRESLREALEPQKHSGQSNPDHRAAVGSRGTRT